MRTLTAISLLTGLFFFSTCKEKDPEIVPQPRAGEMKVKIVHEVAGSPLELEKLIYTNEAGNLYQINQLQYYLGNFRLRNTNGAWKEIPEYRLVQHYIKSGQLNARNMEFTIDELPFGTYDSISFLIGIDSVTNGNLDNTGELDPAFGMFWPWNSSYIFYSFEGIYQRGSNTLPFAYHIGGNEYLMQYSLALPKVMSLQQGAITGNLTIKPDAESIFGPPHIINMDSVALVSHTFDEPLLTTQMKENMLNAITLE